jgi:hypothetical protein
LLEQGDGSRIVRADQKRPEARHPKFRRMKRTIIRHAAIKRKEGNAADARFSSAD